MNAAGLDSYLRGVAEMVLRTVCGDAPDHSATQVVRRRQARDVIRARLGDPSLTAAAVAADLGISPRRLHQVFEGQCSVAGQIRALRIERARGLLGDPVAGEQSIAGIATRCGFGDHASFSRAFRQATGMTPRDFRAQQAALCNSRSPVCRR